MFRGSVTTCWSFPLPEATLAAAKAQLLRVESLGWLSRAMQVYPAIQVRVSIMAGTKSLPPRLAPPCNVLKTAFVTADEGGWLLWSTWLLRDNDDLELYRFDSTIPRFPFGERWYSQIPHVKVNEMVSDPAVPGLVIHPDGTSGIPMASCLPWSEGQTA